MKHALGNRGVVLGIDLGTRRIGLALSTPSRSLASPWRTIERCGDTQADVEAVVRAAEESETTVAVVGLPLSLNGTTGPAARRALADISLLRELLEPRGITVETVDERFSTASAHSALAAGGHTARQRREKVDAVAAAVLLQAWLDARAHLDEVRP